MAGRAVAGEEAEREQGILARLRHWLHLDGGTRKPGPDKPAPAATAARADPEVEHKPLSRVTIAQWLWGDGFVMPGDAAFVLELVKPFGLTPAMSMLDLSAGLGGPARIIAQKFGTYVTGLERSAERARLGMEMSKAANLEKRASIAPYDPETFELKTHFDCVLARGATYGVKDKERMLRVVHAGLKQHGQLVLNEFTLGREGPALAAWAAREANPPQLWPIDRFTKLLTELGFDIRICEDIAPQTRRMIRSGWERLLTEVDLKQLSKANLLVLLDEAERWMKRSAALGSGELGVYKVYAIVHKKVV